VVGPLEWLLSHKTLAPLRRGPTMEKSVLTLNFIGKAIPKRPKSIPGDFSFRTGFAPNSGDVISFEGSEDVFLVHSRVFRVAADGIVNITLNLDLAKVVR
jgi:hypothetical protein